MRESREWEGREKKEEIRDEEKKMDMWCNQKMLNDDAHQEVNTIKRLFGQTPIQLQ